MIRVQVIPEQSMMMSLRVFVNLHLQVNKAQDTLELMDHYSTIQSRTFSVKDKKLIVHVSRTSIREIVNRVIETLGKNPSTYEATVLE